MKNMKKVVAIAMAGFIMLASASCGKKNEGKGKDSASKKAHESEEFEGEGEGSASETMLPAVSEAWDRINAGDPDAPASAANGKTGPAFTLDQNDYFGPYTYKRPASSKKIDLNKNMILMQDEHFVFLPLTFYDEFKEGHDFGNMSIDDYIAFCEPILTDSTYGFAQAYGGVFNAHFDCAIHINIDSRTPVEVNGYEACIVHGTFGDPQYFVETEFVAVYVLDPEDPFVLWASPWIVSVSEHEWKPDEESSSPERMEMFLTQVLETVEIFNWD
ncbi:MAG: hypothetical protein J5636_02875 [Clostridiales bacterium]|nr:hypothetical protein [Clostridiales bacterium]